jgi:hypothetical protein
MPNIEPSSTHMKIVEILTFAPSNEVEAFEPHLSSPAHSDQDTLQRISNALAEPEFVVDPVRLRPGVAWPGASVPDTTGMPVVNPTIGRDMVRSINTPSTNGAVQRGSAEPRRSLIPTRR